MCSQSEGSDMYVQLEFYLDVSDCTRYARNVAREDKVVG